MEYVSYLWGCIRAAHWMVPDPINEFNLKDYIVKDLIEDGAAYGLRVEAYELAEIVIQHVSAIYHHTAPFLKDLLTQPYGAFELCVVDIDSVSIYVEIKPELGL